MLTPFSYWKILRKISRSWEKGKESAKRTSNNSEINLPNWQVEAHNLLHEKILPGLDLLCFITYCLPILWLWVKLVFKKHTKWLTTRNSICLLETEDEMTWYIYNVHNGCKIVLLCFFFVYKINVFHMCIDFHTYQPSCRQTKVLNFYPHRNSLHPSKIVVIRVLHIEGWLTLKWMIN